MELPPGDKCLTDRNTYYQTKYIITCDSDVAKLAIDDVSDLNPDNCKNTIKMRSQYACPNNNIYAISNAINRNCKLFGFVLIFFGYYMTFLSYKYSDLTQILIGVLFITYLSVYVVLNQFNTEIFYDEKELFTWLIISFLIGLGTGFLFTNSFVICSATVGGFTGYFLTQILMQSVVVSVTRQANLFFWVIFAILFSFCVYFGVKFQKHFFIIYSCFIGSYGIVRVNLIFNINCLF